MLSVNGLVQENGLCWLEGSGPLLIDLHWVCSAWKEGQGFEKSLLKSHSMKTSNCGAGDDVSYRAPTFVGIIESMEAFK